MEKILQITALLSTLFPISIGLINYKRIARTGRPILAISLLSFCCDILSYIWALYFRNNYWIIHFFIIAQLLFLCVFYFEFLGRQKYTIILGILFALYYLFELYILGIRQINSLTISLECIFFIIYGIIGYYYLFQQQQYFFIDKSPEFWYNTAIVCYFSGALFSWSMFSYLHHQDGSGAGIWAFHNIANILKNILFAIGLWKVRAAV